MTFPCLECTITVANMPTTEGSSREKPNLTLSTAAQPDPYSRLEFAALGAALTLALAVRLFLLVKADWMADYDESLVGIMGIDIAGGARPVFLYGVPYMGVLESYLAAGLFQLFGVSREVLKLVPLSMSLIWVISTYLLARRLWDRRSAILAAVVAALPPLYVLSNTLKAWGATIEIMALGNLVLLLAVNIVAEKHSRRRAWWYAAFGLTIGLGFWLYWLVAYYAVAALLYILIRRPFSPLRLDAWAALPSFLAGSMPLWLYNLQNGWATFRYFLGEGNPPGTETTWRAIAWDLVTRIIPRTLGAESPVSPWFTWTGVLALAIALAVMVAYCIWARLRGTPTEAEVVALFVLSVPLLYVFSGFGAPALYSRGVDATGRYVVPFFSAALLGLAFLGGHAGWRQLALAATGFFCIVNLAGILEADGTRVFQSPYYDRSPSSFAPVISALREEGVRYVWTDIGLGQPLMFQSREEVLTADAMDHWAGGIVRFPAAFEAVSRADRAAYMVAALPGQIGPLEQELQRLGISYRKREIGSLVLFFPQRRVDPHEVAAGLGSQY